MGDITGNGTAVSGLGGMAGYGETMLPRGDDTVAQVDVSAVFATGFTVGGAHYSANQLYISTDGVVSFGAGYSGVATDPASIPAPFFAIFNADVDTRLDGEAPESGAVWLDVDAANDCVTITWDHVGFYRRNASETDTFQMQIFDRGGGAFDVVYRYQNIDWTTGDLQGGWGGTGGAAAHIGYRLGASGAGIEIAPSGNGAAELGLPGAVGDTGVAGLWVFGFGGTAHAIDGTNSADTLAGTTAADVMHGYGGSDLLLGSAGADVMDGGSGWDTVDYSAATTGIRLDLTTGSLNTGLAAGDTFILVEAFSGSAFADTMAGSTASNRFYGGDGNDGLWGLAGNDSLMGGTGNDTLLADEGDDHLYGGLGADLLQGGAGHDTLAGGLGDDVLYGGTGGGVLTLSAEAHTPWTGEASTSVAHAILSDVLFGGAGNDILTGSDDSDRLLGGLGNDLLFGGLGTDRLDGGPRSDTLTGGGGADRFVGSGQTGNGHDTIMDFDSAEGDTLDFDVGATRTDFAVTFSNVPDAGNAAVAEAIIIYIPTGSWVWTIIDGAGDGSIVLHSPSMNSFDLL